MTNTSPIEILKQNHLKHTKQRIRVLEDISANTTAVSQPTLEKKLGKEIDRVTLYRILNTYVEKGILHRIVDLNGTANYAICSSACSADQHHDEHVHFNCTQCNKVFCLATKVPEISIAEGFKAEAISLIAYGICKECSKA
ncbi:Fur family transcriptional regulator [Pedobacter insulae]|uniref:Fur family transcriptional regulator, ferric uptake regulator n=1 Tax=Pedobacter insulae TaxID=414048 RepID=A0A1I2UM15_9SPHI|nr:Fur family transcriptional regulator [Pedobacter insulae]SFG75821.1 Fur family transcriptional regulator, ferric uptake regulator [Pedobacter insulae]